MESGYTSLSLKDVALIVKDRYRPAQYAVLKPHLEDFRKVCHSIPELFEKLDGFLNQSMMASSQLDPVHKALIDKRFKTLVRNELSKRFGDEIHLVRNLDDIIGSSRSLKEIQVKVQVEISNKKNT